jgi:hypothetical protein
MVKKTEYTLSVEVSELRQWTGNRDEKGKPIFKGTGEWMWSLSGGKTGMGGDGFKTSKAAEKAGIESMNRLTKKYREEGLTVHNQPTQIEAF